MLCSHPLADLRVPDASLHNGLLGWQHRSLKSWMGAVLCTILGVRGYGAIVCLWLARYFNYAALVVMWSCTSE
jgi:hypothetical protein